MDKLNVYRITILGVVSVIVLGSIAVVLTLPTDPTAEQYRVGLITAISVPTIAALLTLLRADTVNSKVDRVSSEVNGHLDAHNVLLDSALQTIREVKQQTPAAGIDVTVIQPDPNVPPPGI